MKQWLLGIVLTAFAGGLARQLAPSGREQAMVRLDEIVRQLNSGNLELEKAMELFEEGLKLTQQCEVQLKAFENKMNTLIVETAGNA